MSVEQRLRSILIADILADWGREYVINGFIGAALELGFEEYYEPDDEDGDAEARARFEAERAHLPTADTADDLKGFFVKVISDWGLRDAERAFISAYHLDRERLLSLKEYMIFYSQLYRGWILYFLESG